MWWISYFTADHKIVREPIGPLDEARNKIAEIRSKKKGKYEVIVQKRRTTFRELMELYKTEGDGKGYILQFEKSYTEFFGDRKLSSISHSDLFDFKKKMHESEKRIWW